MDDLDHSIHISEYDWTSFYEESEECDLLQALLACPDDASLSDSETSEDSVVCTGRQETQQRPDATGDRAECSTAGCPIEQEATGCLKLSVQLNQSGGAATKPEEGNVPHKEIRLDCSGQSTISTEEVCVKPAEDTKEEETSIRVTNTLQIEHLTSGESDKLTKDGDVQTESGLKTTEDPDLLSSNQTGLSVKEAHTAERAVRQDESVVTVRAEKERWFVTMSVSPARQRKKKLRQKKTCEGSGQKNSADKKKPEGCKDRKSANAEGLQLGAVLDSSQTASTSSEEDILSKQIMITHSPKETIAEPRIDGNKCEPGSLKSRSGDVFPAPQVESVESDELVENAEFFSVHSCDSESYLSAAESVEELQRHLHEPLTIKQRLGCSLSLKPVSGLTKNTDADRTQDRQMHCGGGTLSRNATAPNCEAYESAGAEPSLTFPSAVQTATTMPDDSSTCDNDARGTLLCMPSDTTGPHKHEINLSECACLPPVPDLKITPCSEADSPETFAQAAGHTRPVYAISAFWDEMEKLTINDILQLRMGASTPSREAQETATPNAEGAPTNLSPLLDNAEYDPSDSALVDTSDATDSDYFTQTDDSKPDHSSCDFSTSDFEEEYWQFMSASRNPSPDPHSKRQQSRDDSPFSQDEESTSSEGKETPVPSEENFAEQCFDDQEILTCTSGEPPWARGLTKSKSMHDVKALHKEGLSLPSLQGHDESSLFLRSKPLEENTVLKVSDSLGAPVSSNTDLIDLHYQISFPEVFEYFFTEDEVNTESWCVTIYDPEDISVAPVFEDTLCARRDECSLHCSIEKPIPIFSCSHPTVRELTLPKPDYVFSRTSYEGVEDISPFRVVSHSFIQADQRGCTTAVVGGGPPGWKSLLALRKIRFHDKGSIWCRSSGGWVLPVESEGILMRREDAAVFSEGRVLPVSSQVLGELEEQQRILETVWTAKREGIFSTLKQADMCLVCIAFASWVLRSSDPDAADAWKAALLANVSALSAIQYLRQYVKKTTPPQDEP